MSEDSLTFISNEEIDEKIETILRQTDYTPKLAKEKLKECNFDHILVIKRYLGITEKKAPPKISSVNQEIYKQIRHKLDESMRDYNIRKEEKEK